jgi:AcrR family transcriptional regulator
MPASEQKRRRRKEARPAEIMAAGLQLFSDKGFAATRLEDVADAAGVSKATIYLYFDSKADLFKAIVRDVASPRVGEIESFIDGFQGSATDLLRGLYLRATTIVGSPEMRPIIKVVLAEAGNFPEIAEFYRTEIAFRALNNISRIIERGIASGEFRPCDAIATAQSIVFPLLMNALATQVFGPLPELDPERFFPSHLDFVLRGLAADKET